MGEERRADGAGGISRRVFLKGAGGVAAGGALGARAARGARAGRAQGGAQAAGPVRLSGEHEVTLSINGADVKLVVEPRTTLLSALRTRCEPPLTGAKEVCDRGACGACTVLLGGKPVYACMQLAASCVGREVRTIEGLAPPDALGPVQQAFCQEDALMCGFCTPGFVMSITACLESRLSPSLEELKAACAGNVCRCGTYPHVFSAALAAARAGRGEGGR